MSNPDSTPNAVPPQRDDYLSTNHADHRPHSPTPTNSHNRQPTSSDQSYNNHSPRLSRTISDGMSALRPLRSHSDRGGHDSSDDDLNREIEVVFDSDSARRRKSSIVSSEVGRLILEGYAGRPVGGKKEIGAGGGEGDVMEAKLERGISQCMVHKLVEKTSRGPTTQDGASAKLDQIEEVSKEKEGLVPSSSSSTSGKDGSAVVRRKEDTEVKAVHSRLLTKKQLSDMAMSVRSLAKKLGSLRVKLKIRSVFLLTKAHDRTLIRKTRDVARWLLDRRARGVPYIVYVEDTMKENRDFDAQGLVKEQEGEGWAERLKYWDNELARKHPHTFDFVITLGGDGTVLYASWLFQRVVPPVLSFALGSLGFLTKFDFGKYEETLEKAFKEGVTISLRLRFEGTVMRSQRSELGNGEDLVEELISEETEDGERTHRPDGTFEILNDIVVDRGPNPTMSTIELFGDEEHLTTVQADGICVATPTGSTAYNLAAGGSLCHPENPVILVTAICAHTLSFRPIILPDTIVLRLGVPYDARANSWASFDGRERIELCPGDYVTISASRYPFANVMPPGRRSEDWVNSISRTLQWNSRQRQKAFQEWPDEKEDEKHKAIDEDRQDAKRAGEGHPGVQ